MTSNKIKAHKNTTQGNRKRKYVHKQAKMESQRNNVAYSKNKKKQRNRHQYNTDDGGQAIGEEMSMYRWAGVEVRQAYKSRKQAAIMV